jgi:UDP-N-acetyl-D-glucosamine dehydrogenase
VLGAFVGEGLLSATTDLARLAECDAISICVPTPLNKTKDPDLSTWSRATQAVRQCAAARAAGDPGEHHLPGHHPRGDAPGAGGDGADGGRGLLPLLLARSGWTRATPVWHTRNTPKVIGGVTPATARGPGLALYSRIFDTMVPVESAEAAELVKLYENTFRMINIALANEMAQVCDRLGVDVWEVIEAAATKPFGFMKFTPGRGWAGTASRWTRTTSRGRCGRSPSRRA